MTEEQQDFGALEKPHEEHITRVTVPELDAMLGKPLRVLADGFVRVVDYQGSDESVVQAARVSYGRGTRRVHEDRGLIRYLMRHRHTTPFEMADIKFHVRVPMDTWRQWVRHRTASINEYSTRYSIAIDRTHRTPPDKWRLQAEGNRQGSEGYADPQIGEHLTAREAELFERARQVYDELIEKGVAREQARKDLPLSTYTESYWKINLWNLLHFLSLRMDDHAQQEIREYANTIGYQVVAKWVPAVWQAFLDYNFNAVHLSAREVEILKQLMAGETERAQELARGFGWLEWDEQKGNWRRNRERTEFVQKMKERFAYKVSWKKPKRL